MAQLKRKTLLRIEKLKRQLNTEKSTMKSIVEMITMEVHLLQIIQPRTISILLCILSFTLCGADNMHIDEKRVNKIVIKMAHLGTCFEEEVHLSRFVWNYKALSNNRLTQKELIDSNEIHLFCSMLANLREETPNRPVYRQSVSMSPSNINARDCLVPYLLNHQTDLPRCNHFIDAFHVHVKIELYMDNSKHISVIWGDGSSFDYKRKRYNVTENMRNYLLEIYINSRI